MPTLKGTSVPSSPSVPSNTLTDFDNKFKNIWNNNPDYEEYKTSPKKTFEEVKHQRAHLDRVYGKTLVGQKPPKETKKPVEVRALVIFDGTFNNRANTTLRLTHSTIPKGAGGSSSKFYTNPCIHEWMKEIKKGALEVCLYVEGVATLDGKADNLVAAAVGNGPTGITDKVNKGLDRLTTAIKKLFNSKTHFVKKVIIDTIGFSRGSAACRHFVHKVINLDSLALKVRWPNQARGPECVVNFVGLYDTVCSYDKDVESAPLLISKVGENAASLYDPRVSTSTINTDRFFANDVAELGLNIGALATWVVQLTAADETKHNFALTNINSSLRLGRGVELWMPGTHCDIGGGNTEGKHKENWFTSGSLKGNNGYEKRLRLIEEGWYTEENFGVRQSDKQGIDSFEKSNQWRFVYKPVVVKSFFGGKPYVDNEDYYIEKILDGNTYQFIPLRIMHKFATCTGGLSGKHIPLVLAKYGRAEYKAYDVPADLEPLARHFEKQAQTKGRKPAKPNPKLPHGTPPEAITCVGGPMTIQRLRFKYLHHSAPGGDGSSWSSGIGLESRQMGREGDVRLIMPDDNIKFIPPSMRPEEYSHTG